MATSPEIATETEIAAAALRALRDTVGEWAMQDSNLRPLACRASALTN